MKEDGEEKKKKSWRGRGRSNEWMTDATDRSPLTEQTRRGLPGCQVARSPDAALYLSRLLPLDLCPVNLSGFIHRAKQEESRYLSAHRPSVAPVLPIRAFQADIHRVITIASELLSRMFCLIIRER
jgi:hypothetical protein